MKTKIKLGKRTLHICIELRRTRAKYTYRIKKKWYTEEEKQFLRANKHRNPHYLAKRLNRPVQSVKNKLYELKKQYDLPTVRPVAHTDRDSAHHHGTPNGTSGTAV